MTDSRTRPRPQRARPKPRPTFLVSDRSGSSDRSCPKTDGLRSHYLAGCGLGLGLVHCGLSLGLVGLVLCYETRSCHARRHNDLEGHSNFSSTVLFIVFFYSVLGTSLVCKSVVAFTYLKVKFVMSLCLLLVVLVLILLFWSWSRS